MRSCSLLTVTTVVAAAAILPLAPPAAAQGLPPQSSTITSPVPAPEVATIHAKITGVNPQTRSIRLATAHGQRITVMAGPMVDLSQLKVGDIVNAQYYRSVAFLISPPGTPAP